MEPTRSRRKHPFGRSYTGTLNWSATVGLLERELRMLAGKNVVLQMAVTDDDIRQDGWIRSTARPSHPGVILTFDSKHGPLSYPCDQFTEWQANVRGIALALEALRKVDRYGVTKRGEQYTGWKQLPPAGGTTPTLTVEAAAQILGYESGDEDDAPRIIRDREVFRWAYREAAKSTHPDKEGGSVEAFQRVHLAKQVLERHHGGAA
jgi:hypothetical protein